MSSKITSAASGGGGIGGSTGSTDNRLVRSDGTGGATIQSTGITVTDADKMVFPNAGAVMFEQIGTGDSIRYRTGAAGPGWNDTDSNNKWIDLNVASATADRVVTMPDTSGTAMLAISVASTVGAAGAADALPLLPLGYLSLKLPDGSTVKMPYYNT